jgi:hypothetical protein
VLYGGVHLLAIEMQAGASLKDYFFSYIESHLHLFAPAVSLLRAGRAQLHEGLPWSAGKYTAAFFEGNETAT